MASVGSGADTPHGEHDYTADSEDEKDVNHHNDRDHHNYASIDKECDKIHHGELDEDAKVMMRSPRPD